MKHLNKSLEIPNSTSKNSLLLQNKKKYWNNKVDTFTQRKVSLDFLLRMEWGFSTPLLERKFNTFSSLFPCPVTHCFILFSLSCSPFLYLFFWRSWTTPPLYSVWKPKFFHGFHLPQLLHSMNAIDRSSFPETHSWFCEEGFFSWFSSLSIPTPFLLLKPTITHCVQLRLP